jgi:ABC-type lipoprotein export system ATPase subunit
MYKSLRIQNFRGFQDFEIGPLARINLIGGKNNVGKTALLEAIFLLNNALSQTVDLDLAGARRFRKKFGPSPEGRWLDIFHNFDTQNVVEIIAVDAKGDQLHLSIRPNAPISYWAMRDGVRQQVDDAKTGIPPTQFVTPFAYEEANVITAQYKLVGENITNEVVAALQMIEPRLKSLELESVGNQQLLMANIGGPKPIPLQLIGGALTRLLIVLDTIMQTTHGSIILFDEMDSGFHYSVLEKVWEAIGQFAEKQDVQIFATTHSDEAIDAANAAFKEKNEDFFRWHRLDRLEDGSIEAVTFDKEAFDAAVDLNFEIR